MPSAITSFSGIEYTGSALFNNSSLDDVLLFNKYPIFETFPSGNHYIWTFYTASSEEVGNDTPLKDFTQSLVLNTEWTASGWYKGTENANSNGDLPPGTSYTVATGVLRPQRLFQATNRIGVGTTANLSELIERLLGFTNHIEEEMGAELTSSIYQYVQSPLSRQGYEQTSPDRNLCWVNGSDAIFLTKIATGSNVTSSWDLSMSDETVGFAMGGASTFINLVNEAGYIQRNVKGTPSLGTGPRGGANDNDSPFEVTASIQPDYDSNSALRENDRFIHIEKNINPFPFFTSVIRSPQRIFNHHPDTGISRKFVGFFYHAYSAVDSWTALANQQVINGVKYVATVWATQYHQTSNTLGNYTHPPTGTQYNNQLIHHYTAGVGQANHRIQIQPAPTFLGGVSLDDIGTHSNPDGGDLTGFWSEFPESGSNWKSKVLEIPDSAFDWNGETTATHIGSISSDPSTDQGFNDRNTGMYIYIVVSPPTLQMVTDVVSTFIDFSIDNFQMAEYENAIVPQSILDQLE